MKPEDVSKMIHNGWIIVDVPQAGIIHEAAQALQQKAQELCGAKCPLSELHEYVDNGEFPGFHLAMAEYFWQIEFSLRISHTLMGSISQLIGLDIMVQYMPYLRLARPGRPQDNIGYHKDTQYGQTPYELAVHVPFVDVDEESALRVVSGSHRQPEDTYAVTQGTEFNVEKGSPDHMLGKPYASRRLSPPEGVKTVPLAMRVGQAALFSPALFHGQEVNGGTATRVTTDLRYVNPNVDVKLKIGKIRAGYVPIAHSPVHQTAMDYYQAQQVTTD